MKALSCLALSVLLVGCIHAPQGHARTLGATAMTPPNPAQVAACEKTRNWHNAWVLSGTILAGLAGAGGGVSGFDSDKTVQTGVGISAIAAGVLAAISTGAAGIESDTYATNGCPAVLLAQANATFEAMNPTPAVAPSAPATP